MSGQSPGEIQSAKAEKIERYFGDAGTEWLAGLEQRLDRLSRVWKLEVESLLPGGLYCNFLYQCTRGNAAVILKVGYPEPELFTEMRTLSLWRGHKYRVQLIDCDEDAGAILLPSILPGITFRNAARETRIQCLPHIHREMPIRTDAEFPHWQDWFDNAIEAYKGDDPVWKRRIEQAEHMLAGMRGSSDKGWLLHGDLHHENILLSGESDWIVIDPKGVIGPRVMDYGRFLHNFIADELQDSTSIESILHDRARRLAGEFSADELLAAGFVDLVVGSLWTVNGPGKLTTHQESLLASYTRLVTGNG